MCACLRACVRVWSSSPGLQDVQASLWGGPVPGQLLASLPLEELVFQDDRLLLPQQLQGLLVLLRQVLEVEEGRIWLECGGGR